MIRQPLSTVERWSGLRLWIYRGQGPTVPCSVIIRSAFGRGYQDRMLARGQCPLPPGGHASVSPLHALVAALMALYGDDEIQFAVDDLLAERRAGAPSGGVRGGLQDPLDTAGTLSSNETPRSGKSASGASS